MHGPGDGRVDDVDPPSPGPNEAVVEVERVGVCGTDVEFYTGHMAYLHSGAASYPIRLGHEWAGKVVSVGRDVDRAWIGRWVTGDTMLGCGHCGRCSAGYQHVCEDRQEVGVRGGRPGALAEQLAVPVGSLYCLPAGVDAAKGALVEPGANALRAVDGAAVTAGDRLLILGPGTIGLLCALYARARGVHVLLSGVTQSSLEFCRSLGFKTHVAGEAAPVGPIHAVIDATNDPGAPARAVELVEPGRRVVFIGLAPQASLADTRLITLKDVTAVGVLSGSPGLARTVAAYADGAVDPTPLVAATVGLEDVASVLAGGRPTWAGLGPKIHVDPRRRGRGRGNVPVRA